MESIAVLSEMLWSVDGETKNIQIAQGKYELPLGRKEGLKYYKKIRRWSKK